MSLMLLMSRQGRSPTTLVLVSFVSMVVLGLLLHHFTTTLLKQHFPTQLCQRRASDRFGATDVIVAVRTSPSKKRLREAIRKSMYHPSVRAVLPWQVVFYMGYSVDLVKSRALRREVLKGDVIIAPHEAVVENIVKIFIDTIRWVHEQCTPQLKYFIHTNDTTLVDLLAAHEYIAALNETNERYFHCKPVQLVMVNRDRNSSTYVPETLFRDEYWPTYCEGDAYIIHAKHLKPLVLGSEAIKQYPQLTQYVTGHLPVLARVGHKNITDKVGAQDEELRKGEVVRVRPIFVSKLNTSSQWRPQWLKTLICYTSADKTKEMADGIVNKLQMLE